MFFFGITIGATCVISLPGALTPVAHVLVGASLSLSLSSSSEASETLLISMYSPSTGAHWTGAHWTGVGWAGAEGLDQE